MLEFSPPKDSPALIALAKLLLPLIMWTRHGDLRIELVGDGLAKFRGLKGTRTIICPNHSSDDDADVVFALSKVVSESFNILTAWEIFHGCIGRQRWLQSLGCLSVVRDAPDHASFKASRDLLVQGKKKIIIFPEGEVSRENDVLLPIKPGAVQIGFSALEKLDRMDDLDEVLILPVAMKYVYRNDIHESLHLSIQRLERNLAILSDTKNSLYDRLYQVGLQILTALEGEYNRPPRASYTVNERIHALRAAVLKQAAGWMQIDLPPSAGQLECAHLLLNRLYELRYGPGHDRSIDLKQLHQQQRHRLDALMRDVHRVVNFIAISDDYIKEPATQEQLAEIVDVFEQEVLGHRTNKGPRSVLVNVGEPISLLAAYGKYKRDRARTVQETVSLIATSLSGMLHNLDRYHRPLYESRFSKSYRPQIS